MTQAPISFFSSGDAIRSRTVGAAILCGTVDLQPLPLRLVADCEHEIATRLHLDIGDVEPLSLPRARMRWPGYRLWPQAMADWMRTLGLDEVLADSGADLMACRGARYHHDGEQYGGAAFCNLFLSEDRGLDVHFPVAGVRLPLVRGTALVFDTCQPHAVIPRGKAGFDAADFAPDQDCNQLFLTWELPIESGPVQRALGVVFDKDPATARQIDGQQVRADGVPMRVCPATGRWRAYA